jgi:predicted nucleotidyltransferase component of viral defense system
VLEAIADDDYLTNVLYFKGGTCAAMLGWLSRFSVDLDFDYVGDTHGVPATRGALNSIFSKLGMAVKDSSNNGIQYFLKYTNEGRNTLRLDSSFPVLKANTYAPQRLLDIDRILMCQTKETMVAHKLLALIGRFENTGHVAGRDMYDLHTFFMKGYEYNADVIQEARGVSVKKFLSDLTDFIEREISQTVINEDPNMLLPPSEFAAIRTVLKREVLTLLKDEIVRNE